MKNKDKNTRIMFIKDYKEKVSVGFNFSKDQWLLLTAMICGLSMIFLDASILPVALPTIQRELGISSINLIDSACSESASFDQLTKISNTNDSITK